MPETRQISFLPTEYVTPLSDIEEGNEIFEDFVESLDEDDDGLDFQIFDGSDVKTHEVDEIEYTTPWMGGPFYDITPGFENIDNLRGRASWWTLNQYKVKKHRKRACKPTTKNNKTDSKKIGSWWSSTLLPRSSTIMKACDF
jgi:hypothetical protein